MPGVFDDKSKVPVTSKIDSRLNLCWGGRCNGIYRYIPLTAWGRSGSIDVAGLIFNS